MSTYFLNANNLVDENGNPILDKTGKPVVKKVFARDKATDEPIWLNFSRSRQPEVDMIWDEIVEAKTNGAHWVIDIDALIDELGGEGVSVSATGHTAIAVDPMEVLDRSACVANAKPEEPRAEFKAQLARKAQPVQPVTVSNTNDDEDDPFAS